MPDRFSKLRLLHGPKFRAEKLPEKLLLERSKYLRDAEALAKKLVGISPDNSLYERSRVDKLLQDERERLSFPLSLL